MGVRWGGDLCTRCFAPMYGWSFHNSSTWYPRITYWLAVRIDSWQVTSVKNPHPLLTSTQMYVMILHDIVVILHDCELAVGWFSFVWVPIWKIHTVTSKRLAATLLTTTLLAMDDTHYGRHSARPPLLQSPWTPAPRSYDRFEPRSDTA